MPSRPQATKKAVIFIKETKQFTWRKIIKQTKLKERTAKRWYQQWKKEGKMSSKIPPDRFRTVRTPENIRKIAKKSKGKKGKSIRKLVRQLQVVDSYSTVHRVLKENFKYKSVRIKKRVKLTASQKDHRLKTAKFQLENMVNIENVAFLDEKRFLLDPRPGHYDYIWTDNIHKELVFCDTPKYSSGSVEVWRAIIFYGKVDLVFIE
jgi:hypothetical protein